MIIALPEVATADRKAESPVPELAALAGALAGTWTCTGQGLDPQAS